MRIRPAWLIGGAALAAAALFFALRAGIGGALHTQSAHAEPARGGCGSHADFLVRSDALLAPVRPTDCSVITQTPPEFTWPPLDGKYSYTLTLTKPDGSTESRDTAKNWLVWDKVLPAGKYSWTLKSTLDKEVTQPRTFTIAPDAVPFLLPGADALVRHAKETPRPRTWAADASTPILAAKAERAKGFKAMTDDVEGHMRNPVQEEPNASSNDSNYEDTVIEQKRTLAAAYAWAATHNPKFGADAARRLVAQAAWSTTGRISFRNNDMASRNVAWTLALGYDWTYDYLEPAQKKAILEAIRARTKEMYELYVATDKITKTPYDSHGNLTLTITAAIAALVAGDIPEADEWMRGAVRPAIVFTSPWGGADGGFGNGTAQAQWDTGTNLIVWSVLKNATGIDIAKKDWVRHYARYLAYFLPPGTPAGLFGDGQEQNLAEIWARIGKAYTAFAPSPLGRWYAAQWQGEDDARIEYLLAPRLAKDSVAFPQGTPNGAVFPSIGWAAMHGDLADPMRTSVYFKSSPYGSYNHSHADQNSFVVNDKGKRLAIASGYYDNFRTPHWTNWYKQTRSTNAITFENGTGQRVDGREFAGEITHFESTAGYDYAVGHAEKAYAGALTKAQRTIVYLRPGSVIVYDALASANAHAWEWNIHALNKMTPASEKAVQLENGEARMCVEMLASPAAAFSQTDQFTAPPAPSTMNKSEPNQWHGAFATRERSKDAEFVALMRIGADCASASGASAQRVATGWEVKVDGKTVSLAGDTVSVK